VFLGPYGSVFITGQGIVIGAYAAKLAYREWKKPSRPLCGVFIRVKYDSIRVIIAGG